MSSQSKAISKIISLEGGYQQNKADSGNYACGVLVGTNYGISAPVLERHLNDCPTPGQMKGLDKSVAEQIYKHKFWDWIRGNDIKNYDVALIIFDSYVNQTGSTRAMIEETLAELDKTVKVSIPFKDDVVQAINKSNPKKFFEKFKAKRKAKYESLNRPEFIKGWLNRLDKFEFGFYARNRWLIVGGTTALTLFLMWYFLIYRKRGQ